MLHTNGALHAENFPFLASSTGITNGVYHETDEAIDSLYAWMPPTAPAPAACPEATFSCTIEGRLQGNKCLLTARGQTAQEFKKNLEALKGILDPVTPPPPPTAPVASQAASQGADKGWCAVHDLAMKWNEGKDGRTGWFSHRTDEGWCKGYRK